jgi:hypothetical protein
MLDMMHCEKNLYENILKRIFGSKDIVAVRKDLKECDIRCHLWLQVVIGGFIKPIVPYVDFYEVENTYKLSIFIGIESA